MVPKSPERMSTVASRKLGREPQEAQAPPSRPVLGWPQWECKLFGKACPDSNNHAQLLIQLHWLLNPKAWPCLLDLWDP